MPDAAPSVETQTGKGPFFGAFRLSQIYHYVTKFTNNLDGCYQKEFLEKYREKLEEYKLIEKPKPKPEPKPRIPDGQDTSQRELIERGIWNQGTRIWPSLQESISNNPVPSTFKWRFEYVKCCNLLETDLIGKSDPYFKVIDPKTKKKIFKSEVIENSLKPEWKGTVAHPHLLCLDRNPPLSLSRGHLNSTLCFGVYHEKRTNLPTF